jgi:hypothetical protein
MDQEDWQVDGAHSGINFTVRHMVISKVRGRFAKWNAAGRGEGRLTEARVKACPELRRLSAQHARWLAETASGREAAGDHPSRLDKLGMERFPAPQDALGCVRLAGLADEIAGARRKEGKTP